MSAIWMVVARRYAASDGWDLNSELLDDTTAWAANYSLTNSPIHCSRQCRYQKILVSHDEHQFIASS